MLQLYKHNPPYLEEATGQSQVHRHMHGVGAETKEHKQIIQSGPGVLTCTKCISLRPKNNLLAKATSERRNKYRVFRHVNSSQSDFVMQRSKCCKVARSLPLIQKRSHNGSATNDGGCISTTSSVSGRIGRFLLGTSDAKNLDTLIHRFTQEFLNPSKNPFARSVVLTYLKMPVALSSSAMASTEPGCSSARSSYAACPHR